MTTRSLRMTFLSALLAALLLLGLSAPAAAQTPAPTGTPRATATTAPGVVNYTVRVGDTWARIASTYGVSAARLLDFNERRTTNRIALFAGEVIKIPVTLGTTPSLTSPFLYTVQPEDTVESVVKKFYSDKFALSNANRLPQGQLTFNAGQTILIPAGPHRYQVQKGDLLFAIAAMFGSTVEKVLPFNPQLANGKIFYPGMYVYIPVVYDLAFKPAPFAGTPAPAGTATSNITLNNSTGLSPTVANPDEVAKAANANVQTVVGTITMPQNVVNLNQPFQLRDFRLNSVQRDASRDNGALAIVTLQFRGGPGTYNLRTFVNNDLVPAKFTGLYVNNDSGQLWNDIDLPVETTCSGKAANDIVITIAGESKTYKFEFLNVRCPAK